MKALNQLGDTIVEVLLAMAILSAILTGGYVTANRAQNANQASQERAEALKQIETQVEGLRAILPTTAPSTPTFCVRSDFSNFEDAAPSANCNRDRYKLAITQSGNTYSVRADWDRTGGGTEQLIMHYRP